MKILFMHSKNLRIEADISGRTPGKRKKAETKLRRKFGDCLPLLDASNQITESANALLALVCIEKDDQSLDLVVVRDDIIKAKALLGVQDIVISAFGHLSENVAEAAIANQVLDLLSKLVQAACNNVKIVPFGWDKKLDIHIPLHPYNCALRSFSA